MLHHQTHTNPQAEQVLTKAVLQAAQFYGLTQEKLAQIIGTSKATMSRVYAGQNTLHPNTKSGELALMFIRLYRSLNAIMGDDHQKAQAWLHAKNHYFQEAPLEHMMHIEGFVNVIHYLDAMRGKL